MKKYIKILTIFAVILAAKCAFCEKSLVYRTYNPKNNEIINHFYVKFGDFADDNCTVEWILEGKGDKQLETYTLDSNYETKSFNVFNKEKRIDYTGKMEGDLLSIKGTFNNNPINKVYKIEIHPFYFNPKFGLMQFAKSNKEEINFWGLRHDNLSLHLMRATKKGNKTIKIKGQNILATEIHWSVDGLASFFFKRKYYYRKSDNLYVQQYTSDGNIRELIDENDR